MLEPIQPLLDLTSPEVVNRRITKRSFWNRFPGNNERALRAVLIMGSPVLLAAELRRLEVRVSESPYVDLELPETVNAVQMLGSPAIPATIDVEGTTLPLRLTPEEVAAILSTEIAPDELYRGPQ